MLQALHAGLEQLLLDGHASLQQRLVRCLIHVVQLDYVLGGGRQLVGTCRTRSRLACAQAVAVRLRLTAFTLTTRRLVRC